MDAELRELYQQVILDHYQHPRNFGELETANVDADGYNPLCGDRLHLHLRVSESGEIEEISFRGAGCAIFTASASMMTDLVKGKTREEVDEAFRAFTELVKGELSPEEAQEKLGKLALFAGVREFPVRVKCATLPWHTIQAALAGQEKPVSTE